MRWCDVDLAGRAADISGQLQHVSGRLVRCPPKTETSSRVLALDNATVAALRRHWRAQAAEAQARGGSASAYVLTAADGRLWP